MQDRVAQLLERYGLGRIPLITTTGLAPRDGLSPHILSIMALERIKFTEERTMRYGATGVYTNTKGRGIIIVDPSLPRPVKEHTICHELAHHYQWKVGLLPEGLSWYDSEDRTNPWDRHADYIADLMAIPECWAREKTATAIRSRTFLPIDIIRRRAGYLRCPPPFLGP
jgi:hypothetical protein